MAIKKLLQSYAFARGTVRFSLKVLKGKNEKANWSYTPVDNAEKLRDVAARVVGNDVVGRCEIRTSKNEHGEIDQSDQYSAVALLASIGSGNTRRFSRCNTANSAWVDVIKLNNAGHYISIDGRPVAASRGTIKEVVKLYRQSIRGKAGPLQELPASFDPLLVLHIRCPRGSYDVNVEPAKDEVMFINPEAVLNLTESLFKDYYGENPPPNTVIATSPTSNVASKANPSSFSLLLAKKPAPSTEPAERLQGAITCAHPLPLRSDYLELLQHAQGGSETMSSVDNGNKHPLEPSEDGTNIRAVPPRARSNMYGFDEDEETHLLLSDHDDDGHDAEDAGDVVARNPWSLAKVNAPIGHPSSIDESSPTANEHSTSSISPQSGDAPLHSTPQANTHRQPLGLRPQLLSPATSPHSQDTFQNPGPPKRPWPSRQPRENSPEPESRPPIPATPSTQGRRGVAKLLDSWVKPTVARTELSNFKRVSDLYNKDGRFENSQESGSNFMPLESSSSTIGHAHPPKIIPLGHPFKSPLLEPPADAAAQARDCASTTPRVAAASQQTLFKLSQSQNPELDQIMEFEHRKKAANAQHRKAFGKARGRDMSVAKLAEMQRTTMQTQDDDLNTDMMPGLEEDMDVLRGRANAVAPFSDRFETPTAGLDTTRKSNPHQNRYLAAARGLTQARPDPVGPGIDISSTAAFARVMEDGDEVPKIAEDDARAYLIRHRNLTANTDSGGLTRTGLKIRRTKTLRLPFETVPPDMMLHQLVLKVDCNVQSLAEMAPANDNYISTGKNEFMSWSSTMTDVSLWQDELSTQIESQYRARVEDELISPNLGLDLRKMIKIHCDNI